MTRLAPALLLSGALLGAGNPEIKEAGRDLREVRKDIHQAQKQISGAESAEKSLLKQIGALGRGLDARRRDQRTQEHNLAIINQNLDRLSRRDAKAAREAASSREALRRGLKAAHRLRPLGGADLLFSSKSPGQLVARISLLKRLAGFNASRLEVVRRQRQTIEEYRRDYALQVRERGEGLRRAVEAKAQVERERKRRERLLQGVRKKKAQSLALLVELKESAAELEGLMERLRRARPSPRPGTPHVELDEGPSRLGRRGSLPWPLRGRVLSRFGEHPHRVFRGVRVFNRGVEIAAPVGTPVRCVGPGTVRFADYFEGFGQMAVVDHGGGLFTVYGNLSDLRVREGQELARGEPLAESGDSGASGAPALYFEIRAQARPVDPLPWLERR